MKTLQLGTRAARISAEFFEEDLHGLYQLSLLLTGDPQKAERRFVAGLEAIGDIVDRRRLILYTETWMFAVALTVAVLTLGGWMSPLLLLILTFALSAGDAFETPTWRAVLPEVIPKEDLQAASALNGIEFKFARAVGPVLLD